MERTLREFEHSKSSRRQNLRALGSILAGAFAASAIPGAAALALGSSQRTSDGGKAFPVTTVNHLNLTSANYAKSRDFYVDLFGMRVAWDDGRQCALEFGSVTSPNGMYIRPLTKPGEKPAIGHMAFGIPNFMSQKAAMKAELERRGVKDIRPDGEVGWSCVDPVGYPLNIWVPEKDKAMFPGAAGPCTVAASEKCAAAWEAGQKNLTAAPRPSGKSFRPAGFSFIILNVADVAKERDFYRDLLGMKVVSDQSQVPGAEECSLRFGQNTLVLRKLANRAEKPYCNQFGFGVKDSADAVEAELSRRGFKPTPDSRLHSSWMIADPDGYRVGVTGYVPVTP